MPVTGMEHLLVLTDDIDATRDFWCAALGLEAGARPPLEFSGYWLYAGEVPCVHVADRGEPTAPTPSASADAAASAPVDHVAFNGDDYDGAGRGAHRARRRSRPCRTRSPGSCGSCS